MSNSPPPRLTVAILTTGRVNPAVCPAVANLILRYREIAGPKRVRVLCYANGFKGLLLASQPALELTEAHFVEAERLLDMAGSPIGSSRVRLNNNQHLHLAGLIPASALTSGVDAHEVAAKRIVDDGVDVLHVIGSTHAVVCAERICAIARTKFGRSSVRAISIPKTIENDMFPIGNALGSISGARRGASFFGTVGAEFSASPRSLIIHEVKGRQSGHLTAKTALVYMDEVERRFSGSRSRGGTASELVARENRYVHALYLPETRIAWPSEIARLKRVMSKVGNVNVFLAQGALNAEMRAAGVKPPRHERFGYEQTQPAEFLAKRLGPLLGGEKTLIQRSGIFVRGGTADAEDKVLAQTVCASAVEFSLNGSNVGGVVGHDVERDGHPLRLIEPQRVDAAHGTPAAMLDLSASWVRALFQRIGQPIYAASSIAKL
jgi:pyrophosphate--fructose-6-phosphate 1-phosphotransferase